VGRGAARSAAGEVRPVVPTLENGGPAAVAQAWERRRVTLVGGCEPPTVAGGGPPSGADPTSGRWRSQAATAGGRGGWVVANEVRCGR
jgi:hypothetical protein